MTEDHIRTGRPRKNARRSSNSAMQSTQNENLEESEIIMDPSIDSPGNLSESQNSVDSTVSSPNKPEESSEICALCNCGSEMALILGQLTQYAVSASTLKKMDKIKIDTSKTHQEISSSDISKKDSKERVFFKRRRRKASDFDANLPPDMTTFGTAHLQDFSDILDSNQCIWAHHCCAAWSAGVCQTDSYDLENVDRAVGKALLKKCSHCQRYGASVECQVHRCNKLFHYPCCASAGAFQDITSMILLCPDHLDRTEKLADAEASCDGCGKTENLNLQLFCTSCGRHFHSYCVEMTIPITPVVRMGWQCSFCKVCQGCKQPGDEEKMLCCDHCDKGYHIYCLNPPISAVPKSLWKCVSCRKCDDCGSTRPGGGPSCRWHNNFTLCDRCYQQRKKGQCCPVCIRAVRLFGNTDVLQCSKCFKCVHGECDPDGLDADKYLCPECTGIGGNVPAIQDQNNDSVSSYDYDLAASGQKVLSIEEAELYSMPASADFMASINNNDHERFDLEEVDNYTDEKLSESTVDSPYSSLMSDSFTESTQNYYGRGRKKDDTSQRRFKKSFRGGRRFRKSRSYQTNYNGSHASMEEFTRNAVESLDSVSLSKLEIPVTAGGNEDDDGGEEGEEGLHSTVVIVSTRDSYTLKQDVCMCCGSFGKGKEGYLIGCVQCGQCFHPFCVNVKVNEVILKRGWRCLDCTVCEGCGRNADEGHLLLCDICDISFHIYCLSPPLEEVPVGGWKCQWCAICEDCGSKEPGFGCSWMANYTQCGPCSSIQYCSICTYAYEPNNLIIQCEKCNRWAHAECDGLYSEEDASLACSMTYHCVQCRPKTKHLGIYSNLKSSVISKLTIKRVLHGNALISNGFNRKTKTLHNLKARKLSKAALREQKRAELDALPLIPLDVSANECGTLSIDLLSLKNRVRMDELTKEKLHLTESGLKSIKSQVIRAPIHRAGVRKERISKKKEESKINIMSEEITCSVDSSDDTRLTPGERIETPFESDGLVGENEVLSPDLMSIKQEENMDLDLLHPDSTAETDELLLDDTNDDPSQGPDPEDMTDPFEFFGVNLLEKHLHMELESLGIPTKRKKLKKERKKERRLKKAKLAEAARLAFNLVKGPSVPDPTAVIIEQPIEVSISQTVEAPIPIQESPSVSMTDHMVKTLTAPSEQAKMDSVLQTSNSVTTTAQIPLLDTNDFPHVAGHEVEKLLADFNAGKIVPVDSLTKIKEELPSNTALNVPMFSHHPMDEVKKLAPSPIFPVKSPLLSATASSQDAFRTVFGDEIDMLKERPEFVTEKGDSGKIDTQKQLRKWELDEKLGENATISPVLYANVMHKNLIHDYKDWPNRARAIARLWRKLPADQREPFRLRARDNRVKSKDRSKKVAFKQLAEHTQRGQVNKPPTNVVKIKSPTSDQSAFGFQATRDVIKTDVNNPKIPHPTILTVPEPQKLSPLLQTLSPFSISSCSGVTPSPPRSPFFPNTPTTPNNESPSSNVDKSGKVGKKPKNKLSKQEKEENKLQKKLQMQNAFQEKEKQWKLLQQHRIFEQQRQAILKQSKAFAQDQHHYQPVHPSARFSATMTSSLSEDLQHAIVQKAAQSAFAPGKVPTPPSTERLAPGTPTATKDDGDKSKTFSPTLSIDKPTTPIPSTHTISSMIKDHPPHTFPYPGKDMKPELPVRNPALDLEAELRRANMEGLLSRPLDHNNPVRTAEQQQALLIHQQYMATQQQYIQWQLAQQQSSAIESLYGPQKPSSDKELPDVNSEEQHQERIRFLYHQRQFHKDSPMYVQQQLQQTPGKQPTTEVTTSPPQIAESPLPVSYPRPPHYPPGNVPDAMYHQMFMEYMMRYRKGQEIDQPTPPSSQLYNNMMTEIAKQYYQRHGSFGKLFPPPVPNTGPLPYPPRPGHSPYDERLFPSYAKGMPIPEIPKDAKLGNTSNFPSTLMPQKPVPNDGKTSFTKSRMSPSSSLPKSSSTLPKSASFQISRIAADSTSNDEYPNEIGVKAANPNQLSEVKTNNENEISSSKTSTSEEPGAADNENGLDPHRSTRGGNDEEVSSASTKELCSDGIHCGTDDEDETPNRKPVCSDGIHCGTDDEDETSNRKPVCSDGIHCGTDDEDETPNRKPVCSDGIHSGTDDEDETPNRKPVCSDGIHCGTDDEDETTKNKSNLVTEKGSNVKNEGLYFERSGVQAPIPLNSSTHITENKLHKEEFGRSQLASRAISPASVNTSVSNSQPSTSAPTIISPLPLLNNKDGIVKVNHIPADKIPSKFGFSSSFPAFPPMESQLDMKKPNNTLMNSNSGWPFPNLHGNLNADDKKVEGGQENSPDVRNKSSALGSNSPYDPTRSDGPILPSGITGAVPTSPFSPNSSTLQKGNIISLHPSSPRYHQIFIYQHQLLIMQFQQYQFQLQLQFQHLSQQQMSPQQQYLLQQQFHQQMMLLQQQFMQQQAQLHRMAANGIQFTEHQLNAMYQQQMLTQQAYRQWVMALPPEQQIHLQQRMQASMQQVQHQMAQIMQHARLEEEQKKKPVTKPRRMNKKKTTAITTAVDLTPPKFPVPELSEEMKAHTERNARTSATSAVSSIPTDTTNTSTSQVITKPKEGQVVPPKMPASVPANIMCSVQAPLPTNIPPSAPTSLPYSIAPTSVPHNVLTSIPPNIPTAIMPNMPTAILPNMATAIPPNMSTAIPPNMSPAIPPNMSPATPPNMSSNLPHNISPYISSNLPPNIPTHLQPSTGLSNHQVKKTEVITSSPDYLKEKNKVGEKHIGMSSGDSLVRKQQKDFELAQNEMKAMSAHQKAEQLLNPRMANPRPMFFPTHPSQLLHRAKFEGAGIRSPLHDKPPHSDSASYNPNATLPIGETPSFAARNSLNQMAAEVMRRKPGSQPFLPESAALAGSKDQSANPSVAATHTSFSVSNLLNKDKASDISGNLPHSSPDLMRQVLQQQQQQQQQRVTSAEEVNKYLGTPEHLAELEARKALQKAPKKKDKILEEKKRLKEIEREKKREEKERMRIIKEQKKVEKAQARMLKQKAIQDAKSTAIKKKQKMASLPIPDAPPEKPSSPAQTFTPKTPPMPVAPKIPLCEPDVHLVYPLVQPFGCSSSSSPSKISGAFGSGIITDVEDTYRDRPVTPSPLDTSNLHSTTDGNILHDTLFPSPERTYKDDNELSKATNIADSTSTATADGQDVSTMNEEVDCEQELAHENGNDEDMKVIPVGHCNQCYRALSRTVLYVDKKLEEVTEGVYDKFELSLSDQLAFCSNECVDTFQSKVKFDLENEDVELVDAVKTAAMVSLDESQQFSPLPIDDTRGDIFAPGMDSSKVNKHEQAVNQRWKRWVFQSNLTKKGRPKLEKEDLLELMSKYDVRLKPSESIKDKRCCIFCRTYGDGDSTQTSRLLNFNVDKWVHLNCALWSSEVYEALNGGLHNVEKAYGRGQYTRCSYCNRIGATVNCSQTFGAQQRLHCEKTFHFPCAVQLQCGFYKDKSMLCDHHKSSGLPGEELRTFSVRRKVYVERDVTKQLASMLGLNNDLERKEYTFRVGNLIFHELGHVPANLLENFSTKEYVYPINFETTSIFWDHEAVHSRRYYTCSISERFRAPRFKVKSHHNGTDRMQYTSCTAKGAWEEIVNNIKKQREHNGLLKVFPEFICGEDLFGLSEPAIQRMIESLPGIDTIPSYNFRFGRTPILIAELPLALNPTGCARTEKFRKHHLNRPLAMRTATDLTHKRSDSAVNDDNWLSYSQRTAHILSTKTGQYRRMRQDWRNCVVLGRSRIQGLGLFVKKSVEENTFIIEYIGSLIRNEVANRLEKTYERQNRGIYMFRIDNNVVVDATMTGGPARYINHSCDPNCVAEIVSIEGKKRIIIISNRKIEKGEELTYDYKFELEDDSSKIACLCGASNCRKWMN